MALGDLLSMLTMPGQPQAPSVMSGYQPQDPTAMPSAGQPQPNFAGGAQPNLAGVSPTAQPTSDPSATPSGGDTSLLAPDPNMLLGHHVNNLLQVTGNLTPPPGVSTPGDQTQANIPGGYHTPDPTSSGPDPSDPHQYRDAVNGPFKTHGVIGDILGHVMDAVLSSAGLKPEYGPRVQAAKEADAINGYQNDPTGALMRLTSVAGTAPATAFQHGADEDVKAHNDYQVAQQKAAIEAINAKNTQNAALDKAHAVQANLAAQLFGMDPKDPKAIALAAQIAPQIKAMRDKYNDDTPVPDDVEGLQQLGNSAITPYQRTTSNNLSEYHDALEKEASARTQIQQGRLSVAQQTAASADAYRAYKMSHPSGSTADPAYKALKLQYLQNAIKLQGQHSAVTSTFKGVDDPLADDDDDTPAPASSANPAPAAPKGKVQATKILQGHTYYKIDGQWHG